MNLLSELKNLSHHSYCLMCENAHHDAIHGELVTILEEHHKIPVVGNPDFFARKYENLIIDDARELKSAHAMRPVSVTGKKIFILTMNGITIEAQNALLKLLEEPAEYAYFFLIIPTEHLLLPTVKSRLSFIRISRTAHFEKKGNSDETALLAQKFIKDPPAKRLETVKGLLDEISKEKKTKQDAINFLDAIQSAVYEKYGAQKGKASLETIETARKFMGDRAPSLKMLLEYVALNI